jgi:hypothetical protein
MGIKNYNKGQRIRTSILVVRGNAIGIFSLYNLYRLIGKISNIIFLRNQFFDLMIFISSVNKFFIPNKITLKNDINKVNKKFLKLKK